MYHTLLVPLDGSEYSERALPLAMILARHLGAQLVLMRAASASVFPGADATQAEVRAVEEAQTYLVKMKAEMSGQGVSIEIALPYGDAAEEILQEIGTRHADLVVMCTHGRSGLGRWIFGSVAEKVLAHSTAPVLLVRPTGAATTLELEPAQAGLLVPLDGSAFAESVLPHAKALACLFGRRLMLLRVVEPPRNAYAFAEAALVAAPSNVPARDAETYLEEVAQRLRDPGLSVQTVVREGWAADVIAYGCRELQPGLIVMATHGRAGVARLLLGSVALEVVRRSPLPVMLIRPAEAI
ncbi:MAG: universal stress protein [Nitrososphaerales archaeon]